MRKTFLMLSVVTLILLTSCQPGIQINQPEENQSKITKIPIFSLENIPVSKGRSFSRGDTKSPSAADGYFSILAPPILKFVDAPAGTKIGDTIEVDYYHYKIELETAQVEGKIEFSGVVEHDNGTELVPIGRAKIVYDQDNDQFSYQSEQLLFGEDYAFIGEGDPKGHGYLIQSIPNTSIAEDGSFIGHFSSLGFLFNKDGLSSIQYVDWGELYSGPGRDGNQWFVGFAGLEVINIAGELPDTILLSLGDSLLDVNGKVVGLGAFSSLRQKMLDTKLNLEESENEADLNPVVGFQDLDEGQVQSSVYLRFYVSDDPTFTLEPVPPEDEALRDGEGKDVYFSNGEKALDNVNTLVTALPISQWRESTGLIDYYTSQGYQ